MRTAYTSEMRAKEWPDIAIGWKITSSRITVCRGKPQGFGCAVKPGIWFFATTSFATPAAEMRANNWLVSELKRALEKLFWMAIRLTPKPSLLTRESTTLTSHNRCDFSTRERDEPCRRRRRRLTPAVLQPG